MKQISRLCEETSYSDTVLIVSTENFIANRQAKHRIRFGKGWMGKDAKIQYVYYRHREGIKGIHVLVSISSRALVTNCWLECPTNRIHLGRPTDSSGWYSKSDVLEYEEEEEEEEEEEFDFGVADDPILGQVINDMMNVGIA
jgi:hypothetical protein